jgi:hypothetical protein
VFQRVLIWLAILAPLGSTVARGASATSPAPLSVQEREIDDAVCEDFRRAGTWNVAWAATFGIAAIGSASYAAFAPDGWIGAGDDRAALYVTAAKASVGVVAKLVDPLDIDVKDLCHDSRPTSVKARHASLVEAAEREHRALSLNIVGGVTINALGLLYLGYGRGDWHSAWISFGIGTAVGVASTLTAPVQSWFLRRRLDRSHQLAALPLMGPRSAGLVLTGTW